MRPFIQTFTDRHGIQRFYFRRFGKRVTLPALDDPAFEPLYALCLSAPDRASLPMTSKQEALKERQATVDGSIYVLEVGDRIKIGFSQDFPRRLRGLQSASPDTLKVLLIRPGSIREERALHAKFRPFRIRPRNEWYFASPVLTDWLAQERSQHAQLSNQSVKVD